MNLAALRLLIATALTLIGGQALAQGSFPDASNAAVNHPGYVSMCLDNAGKAIPAINASQCAGGGGGSSYTVSFGAGIGLLGTPGGFKDGSSNFQPFTGASGNLNINCVVGCAGGTFNNNADAVANSSTNGQSAAWLYGFNGTNWDRLRVDGSKNLNIAIAAGNITGFATETTLAAMNAKVPSLGQALAAASVPVILPSATITTLTPPAAITNFANETGGNLATIVTNTGRIPAQGQALAAASLPIVLTAAQLTTLTPPAAITGFATQTTLASILTNLGSPFQAGGSIGNTSFGATLAAETTKVIGTVRNVGNAGAIFDGATGAGVPANVLYNGINVGGNLAGWTGIATGATVKAATVAIVDASGNQVTSFGGSGGTASNYGSAFPTSGTATGFTDGTNMVAGRVAASGADSVSNTTTQLFTAGLGYIFNGTSWDRVRGTSGAINVNITGGGGSGGTASSYGSAFPSTGTAIGFTDGTNMVAGRVGAVSNVAAATNYLNSLGVCQYNATPPTITDTRYNACQFDVNGNLKVVGTGIADATAVGTNTGSGVLGLVTTSATTGLTNSSLYYLSLTTARALRQDAYSWAGTALGAPSNYGTSPGAVAVPGVNAFVTNTVTVSGTVTANAGTNLNTSALAVETGGNLASLVTQLGAVTASPTANTISDRLKVINTTLATPFQAGGSIGNTSFGATLAAETTKVIGTVRNVGNAGANFDGATGAAVPANVLYPGVNIGGNLAGLTGIATGATVKAMTVAIVDASGTQITSFGGSGGTASNFGSAFPTAGTAIGVSDGTNMIALRAGTAGTAASTVLTVQGAASMTPVAGNITQVLGAAISATNGLFSNLLQGNAALSATNGLFSNLLQGNAVISQTNPLFASVTDGTNKAAVKAASTPAATTDASLVVAPLPSELHLGEVASNQIKVQVASTVAASSHASGTALGGLQTIANAARVSGSAGAAGTGGILTGVALNSKAVQTVQVDIFLFDANPTGSTCTDNSAFVIATADFDKLLGVVTVPGTPANGAGWFPSTTGSVGVPTYYPITYDLASATSVYACNVVRAAFTPAATTDISNKYNFLRN